MTEGEWLDCTDVEAMLEVLKHKCSNRKLRLFAVACCRLFWDSLNVDATRTAIETMERYADNQANEGDLGYARSEAHNAAWHVRGFRAYGANAKDDPMWGRDNTGRFGQPTEEMIRRLYFVAFMANATQRLHADKIPMLQTDELLQHFGKVFLRDIVGNPFRSSASNYAWVTPIVVSLAQAAYDNRILPAGTLDPARLAVLADALEECGCDNADILNHLRAPGVHVRGCWVVDLLLGKE